jgi:hypothetical protein
MTRSFLSRRAVALLAVLALALPATAYLQRLTVYFSASFDAAGAPNGPLTAEVGQFGTLMMPSAFSVIAGPGGGQLKIEDAGTASAAVLEAQFKKLFKGGELELAWTLQAEQCDTPLVVSAHDASDTGLIDCTMGDDGSVLVEGHDTGFVYESGVSYEMRLLLASPLMGLPTWTLSIASAGQPLFEAKGPLSVPPLFAAKTMKLTRPAGVAGGVFLVDDLRATTMSFGANH